MQPLHFESLASLRIDNGQQQQPLRPRPLSLARSAQDGGRDEGGQPHRLYVGPVPRPGSREGPGAARGVARRGEAGGDEPAEGVVLQRAAGSHGGLGEGCARVLTHGGETWADSTHVCAAALTARYILACCFRRQERRQHGQPDVQNVQHHVRLPADHGRGAQPPRPRSASLEVARAQPSCLVAQTAIRLNRPRCAGYLCSGSAEGVHGREDGERRGRQVLHALGLGGHGAAVRAQH